MTLSDTIANWILTRRDLMLDNSFLNEYITAKTLNLHTLSFKHNLTFGFLFHFAVRWKYLQLPWNRFQYTTSISSIKVSYPIDIFDASRDLNDMIVMTQNIYANIIVIYKICTLRNDYNLPSLTIRNFRHVFRSNDLN